jgi:hypothetical protein
MNARRNLEYFGQQVDRLDHEIAALHSSQHHRASYLAALGAERVELDAIDDVLQERLRQQTNRTVQDPPTYITKTLGPRPKDRDHDWIWVRAVVEVERYWLEHGITDGRTAIGAEPSDRGSAAAWRSAAETLLDASTMLKPVPDRSASLQPPTPAPSLAIDGPSLDMGF